MSVSDANDLHDRSSTRVHPAFVDLPFPFLGDQELQPLELLFQGGQGDEALCVRRPAGSEFQLPGSECFQDQDPAWSQPSDH